MSMYGDVCRFHERFDLPRPGDRDDAGPRLLPEEDGTDAFRLKFMHEELHEFQEAHQAGDVAGAADALADLIYVALGTAAMMRIPFDQVWREVQRANMSKVRAASAADPRSTRGHALDVVKPEGFVPPDVEGVLRAWASGAAATSRDRWIARYTELAYLAASWSKDPSTRVGAVLVGADPRDVALGYNGFPPGIADTPERLADKATKYLMTQHAERNVLDNARFETRGAMLVSTQVPCSECAKSVISLGIRTVVCPAWLRLAEPWRTNAEVSTRMLAEAGVAVIAVEFP